MTNSMIFKDNDCWGIIKKIYNPVSKKIEYSTEFGFLSENKAMAALKKSEVEFNAQIVALKSKSGSYSFVEYLSFWYEKLFEPYVDSSYANICQWALFHIIIPSVKRDILLKRVTPSYLEDIIKQCGEHSSSAGYMCYKFLNLAFRDAVSDGYIVNNPLDTVKKPEESIKDIVYVEKAEIQKLLLCLSETANYLEYLLAITMGLRTGEILGLKHTDFDLENNTIHIQRQITRDYDHQIRNNAIVRRQTNIFSEKPPKNASSERILRMPQIVKQEYLKRVELNKRKKYCQNMRTISVLVQVGR